MHSICMLAYTYYLSDPRVRRQAEALAARGDQVDFICLRKEEEKAQEIVNGVNIYRLGLRRYRGGGTLAYIRGYLSFFIASFLKLTALFFRKRYDLVQTHNMPDFIVFVALIPKIFGARVVHDIHDLMPDLYATKFERGASSFPVRLLPWVERLSCAFADHVITVTHIWADKLISRSVPAAKCTVVVNVADEKLFYPRPVTVTGDKFILLYHGTLVHRYGVDVAIRAIPLFKEAIPQCLFKIVGEGDQLEELRRLIAELGVAKWVHLNDQFVPTEKIPEIIASVDVGVVPNRKNSFTDEILPTKLLELVAMGKPAVVARTRGVEAYFDDSMVQFFEPGNEKDLARALLALYHQPELRERLVANAERFNREYNWRKVKMTYLNVIDTLVGNRDGETGSSGQNANGG